jgi:L-aminopeptidase/D-esterase-like protein
MHMVNYIDAILLTGGSAYGLDAAGGVMRYLEEKARGFPIENGVVPIVPAAVILDLGVTTPPARPDAAMGYNACLNAGHFSEVWQRRGRVLAPRWQTPWSGYTR